MYVCCSLQKKHGSTADVGKMLFSGYFKNARELQLKIPNCSKSEKKFWHKKFQFVAFPSTAERISDDSIARWFPLVQQTQRVRGRQQQPQPATPAPLGQQSRPEEQSQQVTQDLHTAQPELPQQVQLLSGQQTSQLPTALTTEDTAVLSGHQEQERYDLTRVTASSPATAALHIPFVVYNGDHIKRMRLPIDVELATATVQQKSVAAQRLTEYLPTERYALFLAMRHLGIPVNAIYGVPEDSVSVRVCSQLIALAGTCIRTADALYKLIQRKRRWSQDDMTHRQLSEDIRDSPEPWLRVFPDLDPQPPSLLAGLSRRAGPSQHALPKRRLISSVTDSSDYRDRLLCEIGQEGSSALSSSSRQPAHQGFGSWSVMPSSTVHQSNVRAPSFNQGTQSRIRYLEQIARMAPMATMPVSDDSASPDTTATAARSLPLETPLLDNILTIVNRQSSTTSTHDMNFLSTLDVPHADRLTNMPITSASTILPVALPLFTTPPPLEQLPSSSLSTRASSSQTGAILPDEETVDYGGNSGFGLDDDLPLSSTPCLSISSMHCGPVQSHDIRGTPSSPVAETALSAGAKASEVSTSAISDQIPNSSFHMDAYIVSKSSHSVSVDHDSLSAATSEQQPPLGNEPTSVTPLTIAEQKTLSLSNLAQDPTNSELDDMIFDQLVLICYDKIEQSGMISGKIHTLSIPTRVLANTVAKSASCEAKLVMSLLPTLIPKLSTEDLSEFELKVSGAVVSIRKRVYES